MKITLKIVALSSMLLLSANVYADDVPYPNGYRDWHHVKSMVLAQAMFCMIHLVASSSVRKQKSGSRLGARTLF